MVRKASVTIAIVEPTVSNQVSKSIACILIILMIVSSRYVSIVVLMMKFQKIERHIFVRQFLMRSERKQKMRRMLMISMMTMIMVSKIKLKVLLITTFELSYPASIVESLRRPYGSKFSSLWSASPTSESIIDLSSSVGIRSTVAISAIAS